MPKSPSVAETSLRRRSLLASTAASAVGLSGVLASSARAASADSSQPGTFTAPQVFAPDTDSVAITVNALGGQTSSLQQWQDSSGSTRVSVSPAGALVLGSDTALQRYASDHVSLDANLLASGSMTLQRDTSAALAPEFTFKAANGSWLTGVDVANSGGGTDFVLAARVNAGSVGDLIYVSNRYPAGPTVGIGITPPGPRARLQVSPADGDAAMGGVAIRLPPSSRGNPLAVLDSSGRPRMWIDRDAWANGLRARGDDSNTILSMGTSDLRAVYGLVSGGDDLRLRYYQGAKNVFSVGTDARMLFYAPANLTPAGGQLPHVAGTRPSGGYSGEVRVGTRRIWANDNGTWKYASF
jgi:hypothetical protein